MTDLNELTVADIPALHDDELRRLMNQATIRACCLGVEEGQRYRDLSDAILKEQRSRHATQISLDQIREFSDMLEGKRR